MGVIPVLAVLLSFGSPAPDEKLASTFAELAKRVKTGEKIILTTSEGEQLTGKIASVTDAELLLARGKDRRLFAAAGVQRIERPNDTARNGALGGLAAGLVVGVVAVAGCSGDCDDFVAPVLGLGAALGLGIGLAVDALIRRDRVVFVRGSDVTVKAAFHPLLSPRRAGLAVTIGF